MTFSEGIKMYPYIVKVYKQKEQMEYDDMRFVPFRTLSAASQYIKELNSMKDFREICIVQLFINHQSKLK